ncbi:Glycosyltransferase involved in cell wall bisynthesis [Roseovarius azorensis]|uniref:Glycosyltransferase involved in cell wall bisynthesis n=1 Tax=Roseovarius azorensis TaxID=1287727 RepID=A0A1H7KLB3_9RHOB|nr:glycosyltransferase family 2 protein [Roseovarius azorensis]SEK87663.1 Glycosyltransferase involved in cell wall bisynthesis [Roseovarius azorensis]
MSHSRSLVHVRTPTYRRPDALRRCLGSLVAQSHDNWVCDVYDDDPEGSARAVVAAFRDDRITFNHNRPQRFASRNIDKCFSRDNPREADYFCVVEDDNFIMPRFMEDNIALCRRENVRIVLCNQIVEHDSGTPNARLSETGLLDDKLKAGRYEPDVFRLSLIADIGVSNGGLFWSREAVSDLEINVPCSATLQEYMRTFVIAEPIHVALEPLAVWAENGEATQRDNGLKGGYFVRELALKRSVGILQRRAWKGARSEDRDNFLTHPAFRYSRESRARGLVKSHIRLGAGATLRWKEALRLAVRGGLIRLIGRPEPGLRRFLDAQAK